MTVLKLRKILTLQTGGYLSIYTEVVEVMFWLLLSRVFQNYGFFSLDPKS